MGKSTLPHWCCVVCAVIVSTSTSTWITVHFALDTMSGRQQQGTGRGVVWSCDGVSGFERQGDGLLGSGASGWSGAPSGAAGSLRAVGKNKRLSKGKKGIKKRVVDPFTRKDWYDIKAPSIFDTRNAGKTLVNRSSGLKNANDSLKGRVLELSLADLNKDDENTFRKIKLRVDEVQGKNCLTNFHGMDFTSDKLRSLVRKWQTLIEANVDIKTTDGYLVRLFSIAFTKKRPNQVKKTTYAKSSQVREIRKKMFEIMVREASSCDLKQLVHKLVPEVIGREIEKASQGIYPIQNCYIRKVKILKTPRFDLSKLLELHGGDVAEDVGASVKKDTVEIPVLTSV